MARATILLILLCASPALADDDALGEDKPARFHLGVDVSWQRAQVRFITPADIAFDCGCGVQAFRSDVVRGTVSIGWAGLALEASFARSPNAPIDFHSWTAGVRLDTSYDAPFSLALRFAYLRRVGDLLGTGGRASVLLQVRVVRQFVLYAEGGGELVDVPADSDTLLSYAFFYGGGVRMVFAR